MLRLTWISFIGISLFWDDFRAFSFLKRFRISFSDTKLNINFSLDSLFSLILMILRWFLYLYRTDWTESPVTCSCKLSLSVNLEIFKFSTTYTKNLLKMSKISLSTDTMRLWFTSVILLLSLILSDKRGFKFLQNCVLSARFLRSRLL